MGCRRFCSCRFHRVVRHFGLVVDFAELKTASERAVAAIKRDAGNAGLEFKYYPVLSIGTERCRDIIRKRLEQVWNGGPIYIRGIYQFKA